MIECEATWKSGVAATVITPAEPMWLAGWAVRAEPSRGTVADLFAKALAIEDHHGSRLVLLTVDLIAVSRDLAATVAQQVSQCWGLPRERLMICASHTHCGPEIRPDKVPFFHIPPEFAAKIEPYVNWLASWLVEIVGAALADMQPSRLIVRGTAAPFASNRRGTGSVDHDVPVLEVTDANGSRKAIVFGYACHNTTMAPDDRRWCGDYAGFAQANLEADNPGVVTFFIAGAGADQDPEPRGTIDRACQHGHTLAAVVRESFTRPGREITGPLRVTYAEVALDFQPLPSREVLLADRASDDLARRSKAAYVLTCLDRGESFPQSYPCPLHVVQFGDEMLLIALGGEPVVDYANELKRRYAAPGRLVWVAGYANDMFGYVPTVRVLRAGGYEGTRSLLWSALPAPFAEDTEQRVLDGVAQLFDRAASGDRT